MRRLSCWVISLFLIGLLSAQEKEVKIKIIQTSDIHGNYYPYDFIKKRKVKESLASIYALVEKERKIYKDNLLLFDNGDILQGQPSVYYYNYIDTIGPHLTAQMMNFMKYNVGNMGNHDVETGNAVFNRWASECNFPILGANIIDTVTEKPYFKPYEVFVRDGVKIVVLGMITPAIPAWLPENLWKGLRFDDMEETAHKWVKIINELEKPDLLIGLFHAGKEAQWLGGIYRENASMEVARNVPGFDIVLMGHDHEFEVNTITNIKGDSVLVMDPANNGFMVSGIEVTLKMRDGKVVHKEILGELTDARLSGISKEFLQFFSPQYKTIQAFVGKKIGRFTQEVCASPAYFGPSAFIDLVHELQLDISGAEISFTAPLSFSAKIKKGYVSVSDMFNLYKYENMLYVMRLSGKEVKGALEMSYGLWTNQMKSPEDHLLLFDDDPKPGDKPPFKNFSFNFDSAAGIIYTVDVTKPIGEKIHIISMADGSPFSMNKMYKVALNSYRGNGGGELLTEGAGIPQWELKNRIICSTNKDLRYYLMKYIERKKVIDPSPLNQWKFIPEEWTIPASKRDYKLLFGKIKK